MYLKTLLFSFFLFFTYSFQSTLKGDFVVYLQKKMEEKVVILRSVNCFSFDIATNKQESNNNSSNKEDNSENEKDKKSKKEKETEQTDEKDETEETDALEILNINNFNLSSKLYFIKNQLYFIAFQYESFFRQIESPPPEV